MKTKILISSAFMLFVLWGYGQILSTKEAKVVLVVDAKSEKILHIMLFTDIQKMDNARLLEKRSDCKFYVGLLRGRYEIKDDEIVPKNNTTVIMYTEKQIFPEKIFFSTDDLSPGDAFDLGKTKAKVVSSKKGELVLRT